MRHYLDHAASSPLVPEARAAMAEAFELVGNPASLHTSGRRARSRLEDARESIAQDLGADPAEVIFTSGGTEADNLAVHGGWAARRLIRPAVVASTIEHPGVLETVSAMGLRGADVRFCPVTARGEADVDWLAEHLDDTVGVASLMWVNNETGVLQPVAELAEHARRVGVWSHSDAVQATGHVPVLFHDSGLDLMSVSAHKVGGPVGIGALLARRDAGVQAVQFGGGQERGVRSGTAMVALAAGFAAALHRAVDTRAEETTRLARFRERVIHTADALDGVQVLGQGAAASPHIVNLHLAGARADDVLMLLDQQGIDCSTGSACTAGVSQPSHVASAMGLSEQESAETVRFSFGWNTTDADIACLLYTSDAADE